MTILNLLVYDGCGIGETGLRSRVAEGMKRPWNILTIVTVMR